jgi:hypothetical protein
MAGRLAWMIAIAFLAATVLFTLLYFDITRPPPPAPNADHTFIDLILAGFERDQAAWVQIVASSLLFAVAFGALAALGIVLRGVLGRDDPRTALLTVTFVLAGAIGVASQVMLTGATEFAISAEYCDCNFLAEEVIGRQMALGTIFSMTSWLTDATTVLFAIGLLALAPAAAVSWPSGLVTYTRVVAILGFLTVVYSRIIDPLVHNPGGPEAFDHHLVGGVIVGVFAGILVPIWAVWLARALRPASDVSPEETASET